MAERPILMNGAMVRATLAGRKTQTRRVVSLQPGDEACVTVERHHPTVIDRRGDEQPGPEIFGAHWDDGACGLRCPYGQPGDHLYVRETWMPDPPIDDTWASTQWNGCGRVISEIPERFHHPRFCNYAADWLHGPIRWTPSIHMPRWASRITLEITDVRVERAQSISFEDALAEGVADYRGLIDGECTADETADQCARRLRWPQRQFQQLWHDINGPESWAANPWLWVVSFRPIAPTT